MAAPSKIDYALIEDDWRAGIKSPEQLASDYLKQTGVSVTRAAIIKHFEKRKVPRDLTAKIQAKADAMLAESLVTGKVTSETLAKDVDVIASNATMQANKILEHRQDIVRYRKLASKMLSELEAETDNVELFEQLGILLNSPDDKGMDKLNDIYHKVISTESRSKTLKNLADILKIMIALEREAFGLDKGLNKDQSLGEFLESLK